MIKYSLYFGKYCETFRLYSSNKEEQHLVSRLKFVLERGFKQFSKLYEIKKDLVINVNQQMKDNSSSVFELTENEFISNFVKDIDD